MKLKLDQEFQITVWSALVTIALFTLAVAVLPLGAIFAINTLFPLLSIPYNFWTWGSMLFLKVYLFRKAIVSPTKTTS